MPTLVVENVPLEIYANLCKRAVDGGRSLPEEALQLLEQVLRNDASSPRLPDLIVSEEISAPFDLPRSSRPTSVEARTGQP